MVYLLCILLLSQILCLLEYALPYIIISNVGIDNIVKSRHLSLHNNIDSTNNEVNDDTIKNIYVDDISSSSDDKPLESDVIEITRNSLVTLMEQSWNKVTKMVDAEVLAACESDLKSATSLLVLATIRRAADEFPTSRDTFQGMLREADSNKDGALSYTEWNSWLTHSDDLNTEQDYLNEKLISNSTMLQIESLDSEVLPNSSYSELYPPSKTATVAISPSVGHHKSTHPRDPMVLALSQVLGSAVYTMRVVARMTNNPQMLAASFVSGGMSAGVLDDAVCKRMLARLPPTSRELIVYAMSLEASSLATSVSEGFSYPNSDGRYSGFRASRASKVKKDSSQSVVKPEPVSQDSRIYSTSSRGDMKAQLSAGLAHNPKQHNTVSTFKPLHKRKGQPYDGDLRRSLKSRWQRKKHNSDEAIDANYDVVDDSSIIMTVDLTSVALVSAPPIADDDLTKTSITRDVFDAIKQRLATMGNETNSNSTGNGNYKSNSNDGNISSSQWDGADPWDDGVSVTESYVSGRDVSRNSVKDFDCSIVNDLNRQHVTVAGTVIKPEGEVVFTSSTDNSSVEHCIASDGGNSDTTLSGHLISGDTAQIVRQDAAMKSPSEITDNLENLNLLTFQIQDLMSDVTRLRGEMEDFDDSFSGKMRTLMLAKSNQRQDVVGLALALRSARLQHTSMLSTAQKQQLAIETLQLWAPMSYQVGLSSYTPELEVHSYVHLFPRSFGSFISWYTVFRPIARNLIRIFRNQLESQLRNNSVMMNTYLKVAIQSRLKTPPSAFKKMVKGAKIRSELFDILGVRLIATPLPSANGPDVSDYHSKFSNNNEIKSPTGKNIRNYDIYLDNNGRSNRSSSDNEVQSNPTSTAEDGLYVVYDIICEKLDGWCEVKPSRFKDYVRYPKASGYQSLHTSLRHIESGICVEVQIRTTEMHWVAEYGSASHSNYKALALPPERQ